MRVERPDRHVGETKSLERLLAELRSTLGNVMSKQKPKKNVALGTGTCQNPVNNSQAVGCAIIYLFCMKETKV